MRWRDLQWVASESLPQSASWRARFVARYFGAAQAAEPRAPDERREVRSPVWDDPWIDLGGEG
jgi:hypothetical protein